MTKNVYKLKFMLVQFRASSYFNTKFELQQEDKLFKSTPIFDDSNVKLLFNTHYWKPTSTALIYFYSNLGFICTQDIQVCLIII